MYKVLCILFLIVSKTTLAQDFDSLEDYSVDQLYKKVKLEYETLDEQGNSINFVFVKTELDTGTYEIELSDGPGDLYQINNSNLYLKFDYYFGYAGYATKCYLKVESYATTIYKIED